MSAPFPTCSGRYTAVHDSGIRSRSDIRYIVLHTTESPADSAPVVARYFTKESSGGSAHLVIDDDHCYRTLNDLVIPWAAPPLNTSGYHIEHCGYAKWTEREWHRHELTLNQSAYKAALRCGRYSIVPRLLTDTQLKTGTRSGIVTHAQVSRVFHKSDHTDPGPGFPLDFYVGLVKDYLEADIAP